MTEAESRGLVKDVFVTRTRGGQQVQEPLYVDPLLRANLDLIKKTVRDDFDWIFCVDGTEGSGKSVLAQQLAKYCDPSFNIERVCFTPDEFRQAVVKAQKYQAIVYDEARAGLDSRASMTLTNRTLVNMLAEIRQKNLIVFIVLPTFFDLDRNVALWRCRGLIHVELRQTPNGFQRGLFKFYNSVTKKFLYIKGKKFYDYRVVGPNIRGTFARGYVIDEVEYRERKKKALEKYGESETVNKMLADFKKQLVMNLYDNKHALGLTEISIASIIGVTDRTIRNYRKEFEEKRLQNAPEGGTGSVLDAGKAETYIINENTKTNQIEISLGTEEKPIIQKDLPTINQNEDNQE